MTASPAPRDLTPFFAPRSIAVVGAGERATSSGGAIMQMLRQAGYGGRVVPVNPKGGEIFGYPAVTSIAAIDPPVDMAVIVIRPDAILEAVTEAANRGIRNLLILPGGFAEAGPAGVARNEALKKLAHERGLTIAGPNCAGIVHLDPKWRFAATFLRDLPPGTMPGADTNGLAFISQSGALAEEFIDKANARSLPLTSVVSVGNAVHLGVEDYLAWLGERPEIAAALVGAALVGAVFLGEGREISPALELLDDVVGLRLAGHQDVAGMHLWLALEAGLETKQSLLLSSADLNALV